MTTVNDIYSQLGKWKEIVIIDLYNAFFQNHMADDDQQWLGIMTPFFGLCVLARLGQGLLGQSKELDELMAKVLGEDIKEGRAIKLQDNIIIGGDNQLEAAKNYVSLGKTAPGQSPSGTRQNRNIPQIGRHLWMGVGKRRTLESVSSLQKFSP